MRLALDGRGLPTRAVITSARAGDKPQILPPPDGINMARAGYGRVEHRMPHHRPHAIAAARHPRTENRPPRRGRSRAMATARSNCETSPRPGSLPPASSPTMPRSRYRTAQVAHSSAKSAGPPQIQAGHCPYRDTVAFGRHGDSGHNTYDARPDSRSSTSEIGSRLRYSHGTFRCIPWSALFGRFEIPGPRPFTRSRRARARSSTGSSQPTATAVRLAARITASRADTSSDSPRPQVHSTALPRRYSR